MTIVIPKLVLATHNKGKVKEFEDLLNGLVGEIVCAGDLGLDEPEETGTTFEENALIKAKAAMEATGLPSLADDSGLSVVALNGDPGVYSADWAGHPRDFNKAMKLVHDRLGDTADRSALFTSVLILAYPDGRVETFKGQVDGHIVWPPRGGNGFGYDPMFVPDGYDLSFAEMDQSLKNTLSHRTRAVEKLKAYFLG